VKVSDHLPTGVTFGKAFSSQGTCSQVAGTVTCDLGTVKKGRYAFVAIRVTPTVAGTVTNTATVSGNQSDPNMKNNSSSVTITVAKADPCQGDEGNCQHDGWFARVGGLLRSFGRH
jgi:hypothetical protein